jgi:SAM-dependent methyltransferase
VSISTAPSALAPAKLRAALKRVPLQDLRVLEPACGAGVYLRNFSSQSLGLDNSDGALAKAKAAQLNVRKCDVDQEGWTASLDGDEPFEAAWLCDVLMHVADPVRFLGQLPSVLAGGAPVLCVEWTLPDRGPLLGLRTWIARCLPGAKMVLDEPTHLRFFRPRELEQLLTEAGYTIEDRWLHSFDGLLGGALIAKLSSSFWPVRTILARAPRS